jgi:hypothetical protein
MDKVHGHRCFALQTLYVAGLTFGVLIRIVWGEHHPETVAAIDGCCCDARADEDRRRNAVSVHLGDKKRKRQPVFGLKMSGPLVRAYAYGGDCLWLLNRVELTSLRAYELTSLRARLSP